MNIRSCSHLIGKHSEEKSNTVAVQVFAGVVWWACRPCVKHEKDFSSHSYILIDSPGYDPSIEFIKHAVCCLDCVQGNDCLVSLVIKAKDNEDKS